MKKTALLLFIALSFFSHLYPEECDCLQLHLQKDRCRSLRLLLNECITLLPEISELCFFGLNHPELLINNGYVNRRDTLNFYFDPFCYSTKGIMNLFSRLRRDAEEELLCWKRFKEQELAALLSEKKHCYWINESGEPQCIPHVLRKLAECPQIRRSVEEKISKTEESFYCEFTKDLKYCRKHHQNPRTIYEFGCWNFLVGNSLEAIEEGIIFINLAKEEGENKQLISTTYLQQGEAYAEVLAYDQAIEALTKAIELNPLNKTAYFERAIAYFEKGNFDRALEDYFASEVKTSPIKNNLSDHVNFSLGLSQGIIKGSMEATQEFIPTLLASLQGLTQGLWAFVQAPLQVSSELVTAACRCIDYVRENSSQEILLTLVPELKELVENWESFRFFAKREPNRSYHWKIWYRDFCKHWNHERS